MACARQGEVAGRSGEMCGDRDDQGLFRHLGWGWIVFRTILYLLTLPLSIWFSFVIVHPNEHVLAVVLGRVYAVLKEPGICFMNPWFLTCHHVSVQRRVADLDSPGSRGLFGTSREKNVICDGNGNPVVVGAVVTYQVDDAVRSIFAVRAVDSFVKTQAMCVLKRVVSLYPYEAAEGEPSLRSQTTQIMSDLNRALQEKILMAGVRALNFDITDLYYSPEIAPAMLKRQQATALLEARHTLVHGPSPCPVIDCPHLPVEGATSITLGALVGLGQRGISMSESECAALAASLMCITCSEHHVQPIIDVRRVVAD